jgi:hypothetical protein
LEDFDLNIDELLNCEDIEQSPFLKSSHLLMKSLDNMIGQIDDKLRIKKPMGVPVSSTYFNYYGHERTMGGVGGHQRNGPPNVIQRGTETFNNKTRQVSVLY